MRQRILIPIACGGIRVDLIAANRLQWFAEAKHLQTAGHTWWEFPAGIADAQEEHQQVDPWEDILRDCANARFELANVAQRSARFSRFVSDSSSVDVEIEQQPDRRFLPMQARAQ